MKANIDRVLVFILSLALIFAVGTIPTHSQSQAGAANATGVNSNITQIGGVSVNNDPCGSWGVTKQSVVVNIASSTTTQLIALSAGQTIFVCGFVVTDVGTTPTFQFEYGTGASCGTGTTTLSGAIAPTSAQPVFYGGGEMTIFATASANALCIVTGGTTTSLAGVLTYVQRVAGT
jgi:hypothetical protein